MISANLSKSVRRAIYKRDGYRCALCDSPRGLQIHHVMPRSEGGSNDPMNLITLCWVCHAIAHGTRIPDCADWMTAGGSPRSLHRVRRGYVRAGLVSVERGGALMPPYRQRVVAPPAQPAGCFARGAAPPLWQSAGLGSVGCPPPPCAPCAASARLGLALAAPPFSVGAWLRGGSRRGNWDSAACGRRGKDTPLGFPAHTLPYRCVE